MDGTAGYFEISVVDMKGNAEYYCNLSQDEYDELEAEYKNSLNTLFHYCNIVDYSVSYADRSIICSMKVKYYEDMYSYTWGINSKTYYVTGTFNYNKNTRDVSLVSLTVN